MGIHLLGIFFIWCTMNKDVLATVGLLLFLLGLYFIYWPLCLVIGGLLITGYSVLVVWIQARKNENGDT